MSDALPPGDNSWRSVAVYALITAIALSAEYLRRVMPPPRKRRKWDADDEDAQFEKDEARYEHRDRDHDDEDTEDDQ